MSAIVAIQRGLWPVLTVILLVGHSRSSLSAADYALVVGVNECSKFEVNGVRAHRLAGAEKDAEAFAALLKEKYNFSQVKLLTGDEARFAAIESQFAEIGKLTAPGDQFVFYFAGHGTQVPDSKPYPLPYDELEDDKIDEALCASDSWVDENLVAHDIVVDDRLKEWLKGIRARRIAIVLDCCHAGTAAKKQAGPIIERWAPSLVPDGLAVKPSSRPWKQLQTIRKGGANGAQSVVALYACAADQKAIERLFTNYDGTDEYRGQFTALLIECLRNNPKASLSEISRDLADKIQDWEIANRRRKRPQRPSFEPQHAESLALILGS